MKHVLTIILALTLSFPTFAEDGFKWCLYFSDLNYPIKPEYEAQFNELAEFIKSYPDSLFEISGYLDMRTNDIDKLKQALWTRKYLIEHYDIPSSMLLVAVGKLKDDPYIKGAKTEAEHVLNRRVEIKILSKKDY